MLHLFKDKDLQAMHLARLVNVGYARFVVSAAVTILFSTVVFSTLLLIVITISSTFLIC